MRAYKAVYRRTKKQTKVFHNLLEHLKKYTQIEVWIKEITKLYFRRFYTSPKNTFGRLATIKSNKALNNAKIGSNILILLFDALSEAQQKEVEAMETSKQRLLLKKLQSTQRH